MSDDIQFNPVDMKGFELFLQRGYEHYLKTAPPVSDYLDDIAIELSDNWYKITAYEMIQISSLWYDGLWMDSSLAVNHVLKVMDRVGRDTSHIMEG